MGEEPGQVDVNLRKHSQQRTRGRKNQSFLTRMMIESEINGKGRKECVSEAVSVSVGVLVGHHVDGGGWGSRFLACAPWRGEARVVKSAIKHQ